MCLRCEGEHDSYGADSDVRRREVASGQPEVGNVAAVVGAQWEGGWDNTNVVAVTLVDIFALGRFGSVVDPAFDVEVDPPTCVRDRVRPSPIKMKIVLSNGHVAD